MEEDNTENRKPTLEHLMGQISPDFQNSNTQYQNYGYSVPNSPTVNHIWNDYNLDESPNTNFVQSNQYLHDNFQCHNRSSLPFIFNTVDNVLPAMVDVGGGNFVVYGTNNHRNTTSYNLNNINKNDFETSASDYNLFQENVPPARRNQHVHPMNGQSHGGSGTQTQLLESLLCNWSSNQTGTYSPFGNSTEHPVRSTSESDSMFDSRTSKRRMVAQVKPMRMSYSDVLTKSVQPTTTTTNKQTKNVKQDVVGSKVGKNGEEKIKNVKQTMGGKLNTLTRQLSTGSDDQILVSGGGSGGATNNKKNSSNGCKKASGVQSQNDCVTGAGGDDKKDGCSGGEDSKDKKLNSNNNNNNNNKKKKDKWETVTLNNSKNNFANKTCNNKPVQINNNLDADKNVTNNNKYGSNNDSRGGAHQLQNNNQKANANANSNSRRGGSSTSSSSANANDKNTRKNKSKKKEQQNFVIAIIKQRIDQFTVCGETIVEWWNKFYTSISNWRWIDCKFWKFRKDEEEDGNGGSDEPGGKTRNKLPKGLDKNIPLPSTGDEAMKRLLACKGKDPYSILGVTQKCTDDDVKKYYKRQAFLVHPDKNNQPGAEEAFKILVHAFDIIGEPEHRKSYDRRVAETQQVEQAWSELSDLLQQLHNKMEYAANTIRCTNCNKRHKRTVMDRPLYAARMCSQCRIHHAVREGDIWAEKTMFGLIWRYYACMDGGVYDISEWAACQGGAIKNLKPNTHNVQYRIVLGGKQQQQQQQTTGSTQGANKHSNNGPDLEEFLSNLYSKPGTGNSDTSNIDPTSSAFGLNRNRRKAKKKK